MGVKSQPWLHDTPFQTKTTIITSQRTIWGGGKASLIVCKFCFLFLNDCFYYYVYCVCTHECGCRWSPDEGARSSGARAIGSRESCLTVLLATKPSLQLLSFLFLRKESWRESTVPLTETKRRIWVMRPCPSIVRLLHSASDHTALSAMRSGAANEVKDAFY